MTKDIFVPRIRGKVGQAEDGQGFDGKFFYTIFITTMDGKNIGAPIGPFGPYDTERMALEQMRGAAKLCAESWEEKHYGQVSGKYLDMLSGDMRSWDEN